MTALTYLNTKRVIAKGKRKIFLKTVTNIPLCILVCIVFTMHIGHPIHFFMIHGTHCIFAYGLLIQYASHTCKEEHARHNINTQINVGYFIIRSPLITSSWRFEPLGSIKPYDFFFHCESIKIQKCFRFLSRSVSSTIYRRLA